LYFAEFAEKLEKSDRHGRVSRGMVQGAVEIEREDGGRRGRGRRGGHE
jgi:hypothetical protein